MSAAGPWFSERRPIVYIGDGTSMVRVDAIEGFEPKHGKTRVHLAGGSLIDIDEPVGEFIKRLSRALRREDDS